MKTLATLLSIGVLSISLITSSSSFAANPVSVQSEIHAAQVTAMHWGGGGGNFGG